MRAPGNLLSRTRGTAAADLSEKNLFLKFNSVLFREMTKGAQRAHSGHWLTLARLQCNCTHRREKRKRLRAAIARTIYIVAIDEECRPRRTPKADGAELLAAAFEKEKKAKGDTRSGRLGVCDPHNGVAGLAAGEKDKKHDVLVLSAKLGPDSCSRKTAPDNVRGYCEQTAGP